MEGLIKIIWILFLEFGVGFDRCDSYVFEGFCF